MRRLLVVVGAAVGVSAFWWRKSLKSGAEKVTEPAELADAAATGV